MTSGADASKPEDATIALAAPFGDARDRIVLTTLDMISQEGLEQISMREVARRLGLTHAAPYHYFKDKAALLHAVADEGYAQLAGEVVVSVADVHEPFGQLRAAGSTFLNFARTKPSLFGLMFRPELVQGVNDTAPPRARELLDVILALNGAVHDRGLASEAQAEEQASVIAALAFGLALLILDKPKQFEAARGPADDDESLGEAVLDAFLLQTLATVISADAPST